MAKYSGEQSISRNEVSSFVALLPEFKFERGPTFVMTCDALGLRWLHSKLLSLNDVGESFVIGDDEIISSDGKCVLTVVKALRSEILRVGPFQFTWNVSQRDATFAAAQVLMLAEESHPGHQYLDVEGGHYRCVVVTKDEYPTEIIRVMRDHPATRARVIWIAAAIIIFIVGVFAWRFVASALQIDRCLDGGGRWNYEAKQCDRVSTISHDRRENGVLGLC